MPIFKRNVAIETSSPVAKVENKLPVGNHTFQLVVEDNAGNRSRPVKTVVEVIRTATIDREGILEIIRENPGINLTTMAGGLNVRRNALRLELLKMVEEEVIRKNSRGEYFIIQI